MSNLIQDAKGQLSGLVKEAYGRAVADGALGKGAEDFSSVEMPKDPRNGDYASGFAFQAARALKVPPRTIAAETAGRLGLEGGYFACAEPAGAGFLNFRLSDRWYGAVLRAVEEEGDAYGSCDIGRGRSVMVEFVSANPTGPMTIGNARGGVLGDTVAAVLSKAGYRVHREFYVNDAGNQVDLFGRSIEARYIQALLGEDAAQFPEDGYHGDDIKELAKACVELYGDGLMKLPEQERREKLVSFGLEKNIERMHKDLARYRVHFDEWFRESTLHDSGYVRDTLDFLGEKGYLYEKDGATWFRATDFGLEKDEVMVKSNGFYTYYAVDIAYHRNKFVKRGFDRVIDVFGADHHGHTLRFKAGVAALGVDPSRLEFVLMQLVSLTRNGQTVRMSKRTGKAITLSDLLDEITPDAARFFFNMRQADTHLDFDMDLAVRQDSENPVYYVQYAHARIHSLISNLAAEGCRVPSVSEIDPSVLTDPLERDVIKALAQYPEEIRLAARDLEPSRINRYLISLAADFHKFYTALRIKGAPENILYARLKLSDSVRSVLKNGLTLLGIEAPDRM